jgi:hypothetical protein
MTQLEKRKQNMGIIICIIIFSFFIGTGVYQNIENSHTTFNIGIVLYILGIILSFVLKGNKIGDKINYVKTNLISLSIYFFGFGILFNWSIIKHNSGFGYGILWLLFLFSSYKLILTNYEKLELTNSVFNIPKILISIGVVYIILMRFGVLVI